MRRALEVKRVAIVAAGLLVSACQGWKIDQRPVPSVVQDEQGGKVAVTTNNLDWVVLHNPTLENDSIVGTRTSETIFGKRRTAVPLNGVRSIETRQFSLRRTIGLAVAIALSPVIAYVTFVDFEF
jgi:hypothetical protein